MLYTLISLLAEMGHLVPAILAATHFDHVKELPDFQFLCLHLVLFLYLRYSPCSESFKIAGIFHETYIVK